MSIEDKIKRTIDPRTKLIILHRSGLCDNNRSLPFFKILATIFTHRLRTSKEEERCSCWCCIDICGTEFEAKIIHKGRGKFKILNDEYGGRYVHRTIDASDVIRCRIDI